jgi:hypothetical protein
MSGGTSKKKSQGRYYVFWPTTDDVLLQEIIFFKDNFTKVSVTTPEELCQSDATVKTFDDSMAPFIDSWKKCEVLDTKCQLACLELRIGLARCGQLLQQSLW